MGKGEKIARAVCWVILGLICFWPLSCAYISHERSRAYELVKLGDTKAFVIEKIGRPYELVKATGQSNDCRMPCAERFRFRNPLSIFEESWIVDFDSSGSAVYKTHEFSP
jgi:hypothetical protein